MSVLSPASPSAPKSLANLRAWLPTALLVTIVLGALLGDLAWMNQNVMLIGRDASGHLRDAMHHRTLLTPLTLQGFFSSVVASDFRPPAFYLLAQPFLSFGGAPMESAQLLNVLLHGAIIVITWFLARQCADRSTGQWTALLAALIVALLPMMAGLARLFYNETLLTTLVALNLLALYRGRGFSDQKWSIVWGVSAGVGLLVKWTFPIYLAAPVLVVLWQHRAQIAPRFVWRWQFAAWSLLTGVAFVAIWWLPNRARVESLPAGVWAAAGWLLIAALTLYAWQVARTDGRWFATALLLGAWIASIWYFPYANITGALLSAESEYANAPLSLFAWQRYARYGSYLYSQHLGALLFWVLIPAGVLPWLWTRIRKGRSLAPRALLLWSALLSGTLILTQLAQSNPRALTPLLPALAVLLAIGLFGWPRSWRSVLIGVVAAALFVQWSAITFDRVAVTFAPAQRWLVSDHYAMAPASGRADPRYNVGLDLLQRVVRETVPGQVESLGLLVNAEYLHRGVLRYMVEAEGLPIAIGDMTEADANWQAVIENQWIALKDGDNRDVEGEALDLIARIAARNALFDALYEPVESYALPNGERVALYRREGPGLLYADPARNASTAHLAEAIRAVLPSDATLIYANPDIAVWVGRFDLAVNPVVFGKNAGMQIPLTLAGINGTIFAVLNDGDIVLHQWLDANGYKAGDVGVDFDYTVIYGVPKESLEEIAVDARWEDPAVAISEVSSIGHAATGDVIPIDLSVQGEIQPNLKWSIRLIDAQGETLAAVDRPVQMQDRFGLYLPPYAPTGAYRIVARLYDAATFAPIPTDDEKEEATLFTVVSP